MRGVLKNLDLITSPGRTKNPDFRDSLYEGGDAIQMLKTAARLVQSGVSLIALLALSDEGRPAYDARHAAAFAAMDIPVFACTPDKFPELMAAALSKRDLTLWAQQQGMKLARGG